VEERGGRGEGEGGGGGEGVELGELGRGERGERAPTEYVCDQDRDCGWKADHVEYVYGNCSALKEPRIQELDD
jgi:hypothetical protein